MLFDFFLSKGKERAQIIHCNLYGCQTQSVGVALSAGLPTTIMFVVSAVRRDRPTS